MELIMLGAVLLAHIVLLVAVQAAAEVLVLAQLRVDQVEQIQAVEALVLVLLIMQLLEVEGLVSLLFVISINRV